jgi:hypothetical protein
VVGLTLRPRVSHVKTPKLTHYRVLTWAISPALRPATCDRLGDFASVQLAEEKYYPAFALVRRNFDVHYAKGRATSVWPPICNLTRIITNRIVTIALLPFVSVTRVLANGIADMSGTTFTQQLHASSHNPSILPTLAVLLVGAGFALAMRSEPCRQAVPAEPQDNRRNCR